MNEINQNNGKESDDAQEFIQTLTNTIKTLEKTISTLTKKLKDAEEEIKTLREENKKLREENRDMETRGINVSELTKDNEMYKMKIAELEREIEDYKKNQDRYVGEKAKSEKVASVPKSSDIAPKKPSEVIKEQVLGVSEPSAGIRRKCPNCGNSNPASIHEKVDKTRIIMESPRMYGKKYICGECGLEWK